MSKRTDETILFLGYCSLDGETFVKFRNKLPGPYFDYLYDDAGRVIDLHAYPNSFCLDRIETENRLRFLQQNALPHDQTAAALRAWDSE